MKKLAYFTAAFVMSLVLSGCGASGEISVTGKIVFKAALELAQGNIQLASAIFEASQSADSQGYQSALYTVSNVSKNETIAEIQRGNSSSSALGRISISNARLASTRGELIAQIIDGTTATASASFPYHVSGNYFLVDNPQLLDQWIVANQKTRGSNIRLSIPDIMLDNSQYNSNATTVSVAMRGHVRGTEFAESSTTYRAEKKRCPTCQID